MACSTRVSVRPFTITSAPSPANASAIAYPIPAVDPVTNARLPSNSKFMVAWMRLESVWTHSRECKAAEWAGKAAGSRTLIERALLPHSLRSAFASVAACTALESEGPCPGCENIRAAAILQRMPSRRRFIQLSIVAAGGLATGRLFARDHRALGVQLYTVRKA